MPGAILPACGAPPAHERDRRRHDFWTGRGRDSTGALTVPVPAPVRGPDAAERDRQRRADLASLPADTGQPITEAERQRWDAAWDEAPQQQAERALDLFSTLARMAYQDEGADGLRRICALVGLDPDEVRGELRRQREHDIIARARRQSRQRT